MFSQINLHKHIALFPHEPQKESPWSERQQLFRHAVVQWDALTEMQWLHSQLLHKWLGNESCFYEKFDFCEHC